MKKLTMIIILILTCTIGLNAQDEKGWNSSLSLTSQHWSRGVAYNVAPAFDADLNFMFCKSFTAGAEATIGLNDMEGYGNEFNTYITFTKKEFNLTVKDYFYLYGYNVDANNYGDWGKNTMHFIEGSSR